MLLATSRNIGPCLKLYLAHAGQQDFSEPSQVVWSHHRRWHVFFEELCWSINMVYAWVTSQSQACRKFFDCFTSVGDNIPVRFCRKSEQPFKKRCESVERSAVCGIKLRINGRLYDTSLVKDVGG